MPTSCEQVPCCLSSVSEPHSGCRESLLQALKPLGTMNDGLWGGDAIYIWARLPKDCSDDVAVAKWLVHQHGVSVIPGSGCGELLELCCGRG